MSEEFKKRWITIAFPRDLTPTQENILIGNLQAVPIATKEALQTVYQKLSKKRFSYLARVPFLPGVGTAIEFLKARMAILSSHMEDYFILTKSNNKTYHFGYAYDDLKTINASINLLGKHLQLPEPSLANEGKLVDGLKKYIIPDMGFKTDDVAITISDKAPAGV